MASAAQRRARCIIRNVRRRADPVLATVSAAVAPLVSRIEGGVLGTSRGPVSLVGAPPGLFPYLLEAAGVPNGLKWMVVFAHEKDALAFCNDATSIFGEARVGFFPAPSLTPYQGIAPSLKVRREEQGTLAKLRAGELDILVAPARALLRILPPAEGFARRTLRVAVGEETSPRRIVAALSTEGYLRGDLVTECGDVAVRGALLDVFPPQLSQPVRIEFDFDTIASIRTFDPDTQR